MNVTPEQIDAVCGEAKAQGLRTRRARARLGVDHRVRQGGLQSDRARRVRRRRGAAGDEGRERVLRSRTSVWCCRTTSRTATSTWARATTTRRASRSWKRPCPTSRRCSNARSTIGLRMPMGTDAVAGAHGQNAREIIARVDGGPEADGRDHRRHVAGRRVARSRQDRSARSRPATKPTSSRSRAIRRRTSRAARREVRDEGRARDEGRDGQIPFGLSALTPKARSSATPTDPDEPVVEQPARGT